MKIKREVAEAKVAAGEKCDACQANVAEHAVAYHGDSLILCDSCWRAVTFLGGKKYEKAVSKMSIRVQQVLQASHKRFSAYLDAEEKRCNQLQKKFGRNWKKVAQSML
jgi:hypothetical protein